ncbi:hypothetical protein HDU67_009750 [Dinochytrium kinnereticum]|nr:hypothetical protein HDU67_009750 [Dinochytrium kinnereticum]
MALNSLLLAIPLLVTGACAQRAAIAILNPTVNQTAGGTVEFFELSSSINATIRVTATLTGLFPGSSHGFHIHTYGDTSSPKGEYTYGHFNPFRRNHTCEPTLGHVGDFGNVTADESGSVSMVWETTALSFNRSLSNYLIGRGVMIHNSPDDCVTSPTGNSGGRISQGPIGWSADEAISTPQPQTPTRRKRAPTPAADAIAVLVPIANSGVSGAIYFHQTDTAGPVQVAMNISGLAPNLDFGMRLLTLGDMSNPAGPPTELAAIYPPADVCNGTLNGIGVTSDATGRALILPQTDNVLSLRGLSVYADSPTSLLGRGLALYVGGVDCASVNSSTSIAAFLAQAVIAIRNGTVSPTFVSALPSSTTTTFNNVAATSTGPTTKGVVSDAISRLSGSAMAWLAAGSGALVLGWIRERECKAKTIEKPDDIRGVQSGCWSSFIIAASPSSNPDFNTDFFTGTGKPFLILLIDPFVGPETSLTMAGVGGNVADKLSCLCTAVGRIALGFTLNASAANAA